MLCGAIPSPTLPVQEQLSFTVSEFLSSNNTNLEYSKQQIQGITLPQGADKQVSELHPLLKREKNPYNQGPSCSNPGRGRTL